MAGMQIGPLVSGFVNVKRTAGSDDSFLGAPENYVSVKAIRARLKAKNASYYTDKLMDILTVNDLQYALRMEDDSTTF